MKYLNTVKINKTKGIKLIKDASDVFTGYLSSDFNNYTDKQKPTKETNVDIFEIDKDGTLKDFFPHPKKQAMTQEQIIDVCENHKDQLLDTGYANFFLFKDKGKYSVADVYRYDGRLPDAFVHSFSYGYVWSAHSRLRIFSLQLNPKTPISSQSSDPLKLGDFETRLTDIEEKIQKLTKIINI